MRKKQIWFFRAGAIVLVVLAEVLAAWSVWLDRGDGDISETPSDTSETATIFNEKAEFAEAEALTMGEEDYSDLAEDGFVLIDGFLYELDSTGRIMKEHSDGMLSFGSDGRYTSGDAELDELVAALILSQTTPSSSRLDKLHSLYDYVRDNMVYVGYVNNNYSYAEPNGVNGWGNSVAKEALKTLAGNCYYYNSAFAALARGLGYQAYIVTGTCGLPARTHCWCEIEYDNMVYYCDPELEWSRGVYQQEDADIFFKDWSEAGGWCYTPNVERQSEAKKAETQAIYDAMIEYAKAHPSPRPTLPTEPTPTETVPAAQPTPELPAQPDPIPAPQPEPTAEPQPEPTPAPQPEPPAQPQPVDPAPNPIADPVPGTEQAA